MITLAIDTATTRASVAASDGVRVAELHLDGARSHTAGTLGLIHTLLEAWASDPDAIRAILTGDGPGSFTGLRVAAATAKVMVWGRPEVTWRVAPSLLIRAMQHRPEGGGRVLVIADALRGEVYAGCWDLRPDRISPIGPPPRAILPAQLRDFGAVDRVVASVPAELLGVVTDMTGLHPITGEAALPDARALFELDRIEGGTEPVYDSAGWIPSYGRPVEAQVVWERKHGRTLPVSTYHTG